MKAFRRVTLIAALIFSLLVPAFAYEIPEAVYPSLPEAASSPEGFVPSGWAIEVMEKGDLNRDRRDDLLLVLKGDDPANIIENDPDSPGVDEWDANPRILAVVFAEKKGGYRLALRSDDFLPRHEDPFIDDPFGGAGIADGAVEISLHLWANAGTWYTSDSKLTFRYTGKAFRLVAYSAYTTKRNTGETWDLSLDYVARKAEITIGNFSSDEIEDRTYARRLPRAPLKALGEIGPGWDFYAEQSDESWWGIEEKE
jgi:hypothetical protein